MHNQKRLEKVHGDNNRIFSPHVRLMFLLVLTVFTVQMSNSQPDYSDISTFAVYVNREGNVALKIPSKSAQPFSEGLAVIVQGYNEKKYKIGYVDETGKWIIQPKFLTPIYLGHTFAADVHPRLPGACIHEFEYCSFSEGLAAVPLSENKTQRWGYIDKSGAIVIPATFTRACPFHDGIALVGVNGIIKFIDKKGNVVGEPAYSGLGVLDDEWLYPHTQFSQGLAAVLSYRANRFGYIDKSGKLAIEAKFIAANPFHEGIACVTEGHQEATAEFMGQKVTDYVFNDWYFINPAGQQLFGKTFQEAGDFSEGVAPVELNGKWGFIDKNGELAIKPQFDRAFPFSDGLACIQADTKTGTGYGFINHKGTIVIEPVYKHSLRFDHGLAPILEFP